MCPQTHVSLMMPLGKVFHNDGLGDCVTKSQSIPIILHFASHLTLRRLKRNDLIEVNLTQNLLGGRNWNSLVGGQLGR